jgi:hypothetical protein
MVNQISRQTRANQRVSDTDSSRGYAYHSERVHRGRVYTLHVNLEFFVWFRALYTLTRSASPFAVLVCG